MRIPINFGTPDSAVSAVPGGVDITVGPQKPE